VHASPSALVGSVGVYTIHNDLSDALAQLGIKREYLSVGKYKIEGNETGPLSDEARAYRMGLIQQTYDHFIGDVAKGRGVPAATVRDSYGQGRLLTADDALAAGMIDAVATLDETLARLLPDGVPATEIAPSARASTSQEPLPATDQETHEPSTTQRAALAAALLSWDLTDLERSCAL
jgi:ClpP class serine protease